jgi:hypothetical protein
MKDTSNTKSSDTHVGGGGGYVFSPSLKKTRLLLDLPLVTRVRFWIMQVNLRAFTLTNVKGTRLTTRKMSKFVSLEFAYKILFIEYFNTLTKAKWQ